LAEALLERDAKKKKGKRKKRPPYRKSWSPPRQT
jgi:hypothetical protein